MSPDDEHPARLPARELARLREEFPAFAIWREVTGSRARLVAVRRQRGPGPHTVVTADLAELRAVLADPRQAPARP